MKTTVRGRLTVLLMLVLAVSLGGFAWWAQRQRGHRVHAAWQHAVVLIAQAPQVEFWPELSSGSAADVTPRFRVDLSQAPGLIHVRHALLQDANYQWEPAAAERPPSWSFALRFQEGGRQATLLFDLPQRRVRLRETARELVMEPSLAAALEQKRADWSRR